MLALLCNAGARDRIPQRPRGWPGSPSLAQIWPLHGNTAHWAAAGAEHETRIQCVFVGVSCVSNIRQGRKCSYICVILSKMFEEMLCELGPAALTSLLPPSAERPGAEISSNYSEI